MRMKRVFVSTSSFGKFDKRPLELLKEAGLDVGLNPHGRTLTKEEISELAFGAEGLIAGTEPIDAHVLERLKGLKAISRCGIGLGNVDIETADRLGIKVCNTPEGPTLAVAELTVALILALLRKVPLADRRMRSGVWKKEMGSLLYDKVVGIVGFGRIGRKVAGLLKAFGVRIAYADPAVLESQADGAEALSLEELLSRADIICLHLSWKQKDEYLLGSEQFRMIKEGALLVNCSRGEAIDEAALLTALKEERLAGAALDVFENEPYKGPLAELDNVILTPHIGSYAREARIEMEMQSVKNLLGVLEE